MSIWFTNTFIGLVLRKNGHWMGTLSEEDGDGGCSAVWKRHNFICSEVHAILSDLPLYHSGAKLGPAIARKFVVDSMSNAPGSAACRLECYDQVLLIFYVRLREVTKVYFEKKLALLGYYLRGLFCQLFNSESGVF